MRNCVALLPTSFAFDALIWIGEPATGAPTATRLTSSLKL